MRKLIYVMLSLMMLITSCDLEKFPSGTIPTKGGIQSVEDAENMRQYLYIRLRDMYAGGFVTTGEIASDLFHAATGYGNRGGDTFRWEWTSTNGTAESIWGSCYYTNAVSNYLIESIDALIAKDKELTEADKANLNLYKSEAYFMKAAAMYELAIRYCDIYSNTTAGNYGVMLVDKYAPTSDASKYPGRSTLEETYNDILANLSKAEAGLSSVKGAVASMYLTSDAVKAMQARVALMMGNYSDAATKAGELIKSGTYSLITTESEFKKLWLEDTGKECMMQLYADYAASSLPASLNGSYIGMDADGAYSPDYIVEKWITTIYANDDIRKKCWFEDKKLTYGKIGGNALIFTKFPGNKELQDPKKKVSDYINKIKLFRIAEQYLIAAEANAMMKNDAIAQGFLDELISKRCPSYKSVTLSHNDLIEAIKLERVKELIGEGYRFFDLKRYGKGFARSEAQNPIITDNATDEKRTLLKIEPSNEKFAKFLWPIPKSEIDSNPQIKGQQNPGY